MVAGVGESASGNVVGDGPERVRPFFFWDFFGPLKPKGPVNTKAPPHGVGLSLLTRE